MRNKYHSLREVSRTNNTITNTLQASGTYYGTRTSLFSGYIEQHGYGMRLSNTVRSKQSQRNNIVIIMIGTTTIVKLIVMIITRLEDQRHFCAAKVYMAVSFLLAR